MMDEKNTDNLKRKRLLECAKKEFLESGFAKASLRKIAAEAEMTTGAVYFFFKDKGGLLGGVIGEALGQLMAVIKQHFAEDTEADLAAYVRQDGDHAELAKQIVDLIYDNYDEMTILLYKSHGSKYEGFVDELINMLDESSAELAQRYAQMFPNKRVNRQMLHWLTHVEINAYIHMMQHEKSREDAMRFIMPVMDYIIKGWLEYSLEDDI